MKPIATTLLKKTCRAAFLLSCAMIFSECSSAGPIIEWKEEVKLNDGRVIVVSEKKRIGGIIARETWLTINLPEFSSEPIVWHENLRPLVVNIDGKQLYVVGFPPTVVEFNRYNKPGPDYVGFVWEKNAWKIIPFEKIPESIYKTNMLIEDVPPEGLKLLTLDKKNSKEVNGSATKPPYLKNIDPKFFFNY